MFTLKDKIKQALQSVKNLEQAISDAESAKAPNIYEMNLRLQLAIQEDILGHYLELIPINEKTVEKQQFFTVE